MPLVLIFHATKRVMLLPDLENEEDISDEEFLQSVHGLSPIIEYVKSTNIQGHPKSEKCCTEQLFNTHL